MNYANSNNGCCIIQCDKRTQYLDLNENAPYLVERIISRREQKLFLHTELHICGLSDQLEGPFTLAAIRPTNICPVVCCKLRCECSAVMIWFHLDVYDRKRNLHPCTASLQCDINKPYQNTFFHDNVRFSAKVDGFNACICEDSVCKIQMQFRLITLFTRCESNGILSENSARCLFPPLYPNPVQL